MAQTGYTPIQLYKSSTAAAAPVAGNLLDGELAINTADGKLFYKDSGGSVQVLAWKTTPISAGGTGQTTQQAALNTLAGATTSGQYLRGDGTNVAMSAIQAADVPTLNQNTTGTASNVTGTVAVANGGTGATDAATARTNLGTVADTAGNGIAVRTSANTLTARSVAAGTGISVSNGDGVAGNPTITNSGVTSVAAGTGISVSASTGGVTITNTSTGPSTTYGDVGTYVIAAISVGANTTYAGGTTFAGSSLVYATDSVNGSNYLQFMSVVFRDDTGSALYVGSPWSGYPGLGLSGTWRLMSRVRYSYNGGSQPLPGLFVRIS